MKKIILGVFLLISLNTGANAYCSASGCYNETIEKLLIRSTGIILIATGGDESKLNCTSPYNEFITLGLDHPARAEIYSLLLSQKVSKGKISLRVIPNSSNCSISIAN